MFHCGCVTGHFFANPLLNESESRQTSLAIDWIAIGYFISDMNTKESTVLELNPSWQDSHLSTLSAFANSDRGTL